MWRPVNFLNLETTERFEEEMIDFGLLNIHNYTYGKEIELTFRAVTFLHF